MVIESVWGYVCMCDVHVPMDHVCAGVLKPELSYPEIRSLCINILFEEKRKTNVGRVRSNDYG